ncbi:hypothetical protein K0M31_009904 [Melipona bicolor]|uniref:Uncharacterized protein n=1 Tax=Melipona bicolor TaxID=60889 RepID=A0AA40FMS7_9HYME|nr:hypothetical protein K0M31_009904 [Melipona bicolor]
MLEGCSTIELVKETSSDVCLLHCGLLTPLCHWCHFSRRLLLLEDDFTSSITTTRHLGLQLLEKKWYTRAEKPSMLTGNSLEPLTPKTCLATAVKKWYDELKNQPFFGIYEGQTSVLDINDPELVRDVFIRDFSAFIDRGNKIFDKISKIN